MAQDTSDEHATNGTTSHDSQSSKRLRNGSEVDAQEMVIASLRAQVQDLFSQVTQLNNKLVKSYDRVSDLEDEVHVASTNLRSSTLKVSQLELERTQHLSALNTGLLVEKSHVTAELNRLMEKATEEAAQRGQAESARIAIEKDLDDLSATLFDQANTMVAEARYSKSLSERKVEEAEIALKGAEEAVASMQHQMQAVYAEKEEAERVADEMRVSMGKGKWAERRGSVIQATRLISSHVPYQEFLLFVAHLRTLHTSTPASPPAMSTLLPLPFIQRLSTEDSEPTVRLDLAPALNWLSRRSVLSAIHHGQLTIEPISSNLLYQEVFYSNNATNNHTVQCALCGDPLFPSCDSQPTPTNAGSWSTSLFKMYPMNGVNGTSGPPSPSFPPLPESAPSQVYIFKVTSPTALPSTNLPSIPISLPIQGFASTSSRSASPNPQIHTHQHSQSQTSAVYPLCTNGWCLTRLRQTCSLWAFIRSGIVEKIWEEEIPNIPTPPPAQATDDKPAVPPRRRGLWGMIGERASSWSEDKEKKKVQLEKEEKDKEFDRKMKEKERESSEKTKTLPPPPVHPAGSRHTPHIVAPKPLVAPPPPPRRSEARRVPPPFVPDPDIQLTHSPVDGESPPKPEEPVPRPATPVHPAHVPLPDSRPATPSSPGAPPPLPRRAAARRPISVALATSRPGTPLAVKEEPANEKEVKEEPEAAKVDEQEPPAKVDEPIKDEEPPAKVDEPVKVEETPAKVEETLAVDAVAPPESAPAASDESAPPAPSSVPPPLPRRAPRPPPRPVSPEKEDVDTPPSPIVTRSRRSRSKWTWACSSATRRGRSVRGRSSSSSRRICSGRGWGIALIYIGVYSYNTYRLSRVPFYIPPLPRRKLGRIPDDVWSRVILILNH
ncbi:hypothetical protein BDZ89DRAFT_419404 [Hymenopellis radicata]|nr:hypothetical protein BDZ89DRAFT_419404 [Hymenopellis radicata]